jgi:release factor glutamine methyltransferase
LLLANILGRSRTWIMTHSELALSSDEENGFLSSVGRYRSGEPLPYVLGWWEFYGRRFNLKDAVLIPRPETEHIVELALRFLDAHPAKRTAMDIGTGSGCIAVTLLAEVEDLQVVGTDISYDALRLAKENAVKFGVDSRLYLVQMDLTTAIKMPVDLVCANLPYIPSSSLETLKVAKNEPLIALNGGEDGLSLIRELLKEIPSFLKPGGYALFEMEAGRSGRILELARAYIPDADFTLTQDLSGHDRVLAIEYKGL